MVKLVIPCERCGKETVKGNSKYGEVFFCPVCFHVNGWEFLVTLEDFKERYGLLLKDRVAFRAKYGGY